MLLLPGRYEKSICALTRELVLHAELADECRHKALHAFGKAFRFPDGTATTCNRASRALRPFVALLQESVHLYKMHALRRDGMNADIFIFI